MDRKPVNRQIIRDLIPSILLVLSIGLFYFLDQEWNLNAYRWGIFPREIAGLPGILLAPFIHGDSSHLFNNMIPTFVLSFYLFHLYRRIAFPVLSYVWLFTGVWVWVAARDSYHIGMSGVIYGLFGFLFLSGFLRKNYRLTGLSLLIVFLYGSMIWGIFPSEDRISWESHLFGLLAGLSLAVYYRRVGEQPKKYPWEILGPDTYLEQAEARFGKYYWHPAKRASWLREQQAKREREDRTRDSTGDHPQVRYYFRPGAPSDRGDEESRE